MERPLKLTLFFTSAIYNLNLALAGVLGYLSASFLSKKLPSVKIKIKNWEIHYHHWVMGLTGIFAFSFLDILNPFLLGFLGGVTLEGILNYPDWKKVIKKY